MGESGIFGNIDHLLDDSSRLQDALDRLRSEHELALQRVHDRGVELESKQRRIDLLEWKLKRATEQLAAERETSKMVDARLEGADAVRRRQAAALDAAQAFAKDPSKKTHVAWAAAMREVSIGYAIPPFTKMHTPPLTIMKELLPTEKRCSHQSASVAVAMTGGEWTKCQNPRLKGKALCSAHEGRRLAQKRETELMTELQAMKDQQSGWLKADLETRRKLTRSGLVSLCNLQAEELARKKQVIKRLQRADRLEREQRCMVDRCRGQEVCSAHYTVAEQQRQITDLQQQLAPGVVEYKTTEKKWNAVGVDKAMVPTPPEGSGWNLVSAIYLGNTRNSFCYFWARRLYEADPPAAVIDAPAAERALSLWRRYWGGDDPGGVWPTPVVEAARTILAAAARPTAPLRESYERTAPE